MDMAYNYITERPFVFTEKGIKKLLKLRDRAEELLRAAGAFREQELHQSVSGDSWETLACVDYLVESGDIRLVYQGHVRQHSIYTYN